MSDKMSDQKSSPTAPATLQVAGEEVKLNAGSPKDDMDHDVTDRDPNGMNEDVKVGARLNVVVCFFSTIEVCMRCT